MTSRVQGSMRSSSSGALLCITGIGVQASSRLSSKQSKPLAHDHSCGAHASSWRTPWLVDAQQAFAPM
eukprot:CAMPEP_0180758112 /NCGR_PEP_ID=MMETSP1038_2-20121128/35112_1 /TAXON_ID=632150 /ORGANISM="Azadinium spinosum, Strain 3D9" /LENGTH=67 /DNA_ID=CAMNT_0022792183 /DNA_START=328 /DNA_END=528 /DNA_ORIENTATION=-